MAQAHETARTGRRTPAVLRLRPGPGGAGQPWRRPRCPAPRSTRSPQPRGPRPPPGGQGDARVPGGRGARPLPRPPGHTRASLEEAVRVVLTEAHRNPLVRAVVMAAREGCDSLPYLTARADPIFGAARGMLRAWLTERFPDRDENLVDMAADITVCMTISHLVPPGADPPITAERLSRGC
ncbi:hypothetical protein AB0M97_02850 [Streptomyces sp. NPDC051207]|uniref:hypothetical protein n=1 Tax=Streptomyces sp. NPDC051207 TaxID=3154641 RepID=UPI0034404FAD